jgi:serine/threonine-protein kinase
MNEPPPPAPVPPESPLRTFLTELKRRKVYRVAAGYAVATFAILEGADLVLPTLGVPEWVFQLLVVLVLLGFPVALILAWAFDITTEGVQPDPAGGSAPRTPLGYKLGGVVLSLAIVGGGAYWYLLARPNDEGPTAPTNGTPAALTPEPRAVPPRSMAVLPFDALSSDEDLTFLGDGIAGEILTALSKAQGLRIAARSSSFRLRGEDARTAGERLGVAYILEGTVQRSGDRVRVTVSMVSTADESTLWSDQYDGDFTDVFDIQDRIARGVIEGLALRFSGGGGARVVEVSTDDPAAYTEYLRGRAATADRSPAGLQEAIGHYERAIGMDPGFAEAYSALAIVHTSRAITLSEVPSVAYRQARDMAEAALRLDPTSAEAHAALANVKSDWEWDFAGAEEEFLRALSLQPQYAAARQWYAQLLEVMGRSGEAIQQAEEALGQDVLSVASHVALGVSYYMARRFDDAIRQFETAQERFPDSPVTYELLGWALREAGRLDEAIAAHRKAVAGGQGALAEASLAVALAAAARDTEARELLRRLEAEDRESSVLAVRLALAYGWLGEPDAAFRWLDTGLERRDPWITHLRADPAFDPLRDDPRFDELVRRVGL